MRQLLAASNAHKSRGGGGAAVGAGVAQASVTKTPRVPSADDPTAGSRDEHGGPPRIIGIFSQPFLNTFELRR